MRPKEVGVLIKHDTNQINLGSDIQLTLMTSSSICSFLWQPVTVCLSEANMFSTAPCFYALPIKILLAVRNTKSAPIHNSTYISIYQFIYTFNQ
jgi:hypothetical protein